MSEHRDDPGHGEQARTPGPRHDPVRDDAAPPSPERPVEIGGCDGPEPTRYGDWEHKGRCTDF